VQLVFLYWQFFLTMPIKTERITLPDTLWDFLHKHAKRRNITLDRLMIEIILSSPLYMNDNPDITCVIFGLDD